MPRLNFDELKGPRNYAVKFFATKNLKEKITKFWDFTHYPDIARLKSSPDGSESIPFKSERDFIETWIRVFLLMPKGISQFLLKLYNPDSVE